MFFSPKKLLLGATCILFAGSAVADDCEQGPWTDVFSVGGPGGVNSFCGTKWKDGIVVTGLEVWASKDAVTGVQLYYSDGTDSGLFGKQNDQKTQRVDWDPSNDNISQLKMWGNGRGQYNGRIQLRTKTGIELDVGKDTTGQDTYEIKVNSGIMLGAFGKSGDNIDIIGFLFLKSTIDKISIEDVAPQDTPEELNARKEGLKTVTLDYADHTNDHPEANETFTFAKSVDQKRSKKWSTTATKTYGVSEAIGVSGALLGIGLSSTTTLSYDYSNAKTEETSEEETVSLTYSVSTALKPGQRVFCRAVAETGVYNGNFDATVSTLAYYRVPIY